MRCVLARRASSPHKARTGSKRSLVTNFSAHLSFCTNVGYPPVPIVSSFFQAFFIFLATLTVPFSTLCVMGNTTQRGAYFEPRWGTLTHLRVLLRALPRVLPRRLPRSFPRANFQEFFPGLFQERFQRFWEDPFQEPISQSSSSSPSESASKIIPKS